MRFWLLLGFLVTTVQHCFLTCPSRLLLDPRWRLVDPDLSCGRPATLSYRIMGGVSATPGEYPWLAHLVYSRASTTGPPEGLCGGSLISDRYILTAAHCCLIDDYTLKAVRLGVYAPRHAEDGTEPHSMTVAVAGVQPHAKYNHNSMKNDICLVRLAHPVQFNYFVRPICLPRSSVLHNKDLTGLLMEVVGWGHLESVPDTLTCKKLQKLVVPVVNNRRCRQIWNDSELMIDNRQLCAGGRQGRDTCGGDSGGPLMLQAETGNGSRVFLMGVVSYGEQCARLRKNLAPSIYTRVTGYLSWILDNIRE